MRKTIKREEALNMIQLGEVQGIGFIKATFPDRKEQSPLEYGWFDLRDRDIDVSIHQNGFILLDLWFNSLHGRGGHTFGERVIVNEQENRVVKQAKQKVQILIDDLDYVIANDTRYSIIQ